MNLRRCSLSAVLLAVVVANPVRGAEPDAKTLFERGWYRRAAAALEAKVAASPNDAPSLAMLALARLELRDRKGAADAAERAVAAGPNDAAARWALAAIEGEKAQNSGPVGQLGHARRFKKEAEAAAKLDPKHVPSRRALIQFHMLAPGVVGGDKKKAEALAAEIAAIDPVEAGSPARCWPA